MENMRILKIWNQIQQCVSGVPQDKIRDKDGKEIVEKTVENFPKFK